ncbi:Wzy polymerase domain-containing protein [Curvibacter sp. HBC28]|uniref:Wzy polymerase domain-containing protein n=1 Tax=Curvibacter microcysteis TaxID=3026419 RepID=A0ABT5MHP2_9BURK|nr:O-antigen ligase family protein [Curvibacter sp. HBC28]MDD0816114.1 Wzy polymerase domain-containing protein [Curvibacter sp. HBC28]
MTILLSLAAALVALSWLAPNHYPPWTSFHNEALMFAAIAVFGGCQIGWRRISALPRQAWLVFGCLLAMVGWQWASGLIYFHGEALLISLYVVGSAVAWALGFSVVQDRTAAPKYLVVAAFMLLIAGGLSTYIAAAQWLSVEESIGILAVDRGAGGRAVGNLAQPNLLGTLLVMSAIASYGLYRFQRLGPWVFGLVTLTLSFGIVLTESRAALLSVACVCVYWWVAEWRAGRPAPWRMVLAWAGGLLGLRMLHGALVLAADLDPPRALQFGTDSIRVILWRQVMEGIFQAPWFGYGWRATAAAQRVGSEVWPGPVPTDYAHNLMLDLLAWLGVPLGLALIGLLIWSLARLAWRAKRPLDVVLMAFTVPVLVHSQLEFPFAYAFFLFPVAAVCGGLSAQLMPETPVSGSRNAEASRFQRVALAGVFLLWSSLAVSVAWEYVEVEDAYRVMRFEVRKVGRRPADFVDPNLHLLDQFDALLTLGRMEPRRGMSADELELIKQANRYFNWGGLHRKYLVALALNGEAGEALHQLRVMGNVYGRATYEEELRALRDMAVDSYPELNEVLRRAPPPEGFYDNRIPAPEPALKPPQSRPTSLPASPAGARP